MNAVQTFWTKKYLDIQQLTGGWLDFRFHLMSWALSTSLLRQFFSNVILHTDLIGKQILVDWLGLPFDKVHLTQEGLEKKYPEKVWVMRKIHTYSLMNEPFLHVDSDAFLWQNLPNGIKDAPIIVQNFQYDFPCYSTSVTQLSESNINIPKFINPKNGNYNAVNMGIVGGTDLQSFKSFFKTMNDYQLRYQSDIIKNSYKISTGFLNTLLEECSFYYYLLECNVKVEPLLNQRFSDRYHKLKNVISKELGYSHLIGESKKNLFYCKQVENELKIAFPQVYNRVKKVVNYTVKKRTHSKYFEVIQDPFFESNTSLKANGKTDLVTIENSDEWIDNNCKDLDIKDQIVETISFEKEKYYTIQKILQNKASFLKEEQKRLKLYTYYIRTLPIQLRNEDLIQYNAEEKIFHRRLHDTTSEIKSIYLSLIFDFRFGLEHTDKKMWDNISLLILQLAAERRISIKDLLKTLSKKFNIKVQNERQEITQKIDVKIKELFLARLINYTIRKKVYKV